MEIRELAVKIRDAFGPCTIVGECYDVSEIVEELQASESILHWIRMRLVCEDIHMDRELGTIEDDRQHQRTLNAWQMAREDIVERLKNLGYELR